MAKANQHPVRTVVSLSGGIDSTTLLARAIDQGEKVQGVFFAYPCKHGIYEWKAAVVVAEYYDIPFEMIAVHSIFNTISSDLLKSGGPIPEGHYEAESMKSTVVPGRNLIFLSILAGYAESRAIDKVAIAIHSGDHTIYPDCRPRFFKEAGWAVMASTEGRVRPVAPFLYWDKKKIVEWGLDHCVPYRLTRTCYKDQELACGKCGSCRERLEAFAELYREDPIKYEHGRG